MISMLSRLVVVEQRSREIKRILKSNETVNLIYTFSLL